MYSPTPSHQITHPFQNSLQALAFSHHRSTILSSAQPESESSHRPFPALQLLDQSQVSVHSLLTQPINQTAFQSSRLHQTQFAYRDSAVLQRPLALLHLSCPPGSEPGILHLQSHHHNIFNAAQTPLRFHKYKWDEFSFRSCQVSSLQSRLCL